MNPPPDYPVDGPANADHDASLASPGTTSRAEVPLTVAALLERHEAKLPITDAMIREACARIDTAQAPSIASDTD